MRVRTEIDNAADHGIGHTGIFPAHDRSGFIEMKRLSRLGALKDIRQFHRLSPNAAARLILPERVTPLQRNVPYG